MRKLLIPVVLFLLIMSACTSNVAETRLPEKTSLPTDEAPAPATSPPAEEVATEEPVQFTLVNAEFVQEEAIPIKYSCDGENVSPPLNWTDPPAEGTQSFVLIMDDPDAPGGTWVHWVLYNIPPEARSLAENIPASPTLADGSMHGKNSWNRTDYGGPCPPSGTHRYFFKLYALDTVLDVEPGLNLDQLLDLMEGHILAETQFMSVYSQ